MLAVYAQRFREHFLQEEHVTKSSVVVIHEKLRWYVVQQITIGPQFHFMGNNITVTQKTVWERKHSTFGDGNVLESKSNRKCVGYSKETLDRMSPDASNKFGAMIGTVNGMGNNASTPHWQPCTRHGKCDLNPAYQFV
ncbi:hypothetical protein TNCV_3831701 [Trichonephila clavipes]|nr:hypothetical protein TNCV_3831701 [Trichonephila clavipes]